MICLIPICSMYSVVIVIKEGFNRIAFVYFKYPVDEGGVKPTALSCTQIIGSEAIYSCVSCVFTLKSVAYILVFCQWWMLEKHASLWVGDR